jgi:23S rRNA (uracil1939-C5)-methyltransferase
MLGGSQQEIVPVPNCLIGDELVQTEIKKLYNNSHWLSLAPASVPIGHVEIYHRDNQVKLSWNRPYADGGFSQVYSHMNSLLIEQLQTEWDQKEQFKLLDLFSGQGNLSHKLNFSRRLCVDSFPNEGNPDFFQQDLYDPKALHNIKKFLEKTQFDVDFLIIDPPRSGLKNLKEWLGFTNPKKVAYVSCNPHTLVRDIRNLDQYEVTKAVMLDFFPSTYHFESLIFMDRKD